MSLDPTQFSHKLLNLDFIRQEANVRRFQALTKASVPLFMRGTDLITPGPSTRGHHEDDVEEVIKWASTEGLGGFLIDIGANIGLTSCLAGGNFSRIYCYEPNPLAFAVLEVNLKIALPTSVKFEAFRYGLGDDHSKLELLIPKGNWGGAYIASGNSYDMRTLSKKEGHAEFDSNDYLHTTVEICPAKETLSTVFRDLISESSSRGVIKIDAEGYEQKIISAIADVLPPEIELMLVFENLLKGSRDASEILSMFGRRRCRLFEIKTKKVRGPKFVRFIKSLLGAQREFYLEEVVGELGRANYVLFVE